MMRKLGRVSILLSMLQTCLVERLPGRWRGRGGVKDEEQAVNAINIEVCEIMRKLKWEMSCWLENPLLNSRYSGDAEPAPTPRRIRDLECSVDVVTSLSREVDVGD